MSKEIVGTSKVDHGVDPSGSFICTIPVRVPSAKMAPDISLAYHSAANSASAIGMGWAIKGVSYVERVPATIAQDDYRGVINYDNKDCFSLNGQRLMNIGGNEYRYELEQWSKVVAQGSDPSNPDSWIEYLPNGSRRTYGTSTDSNIKAIGKSATRVWAATEFIDAFSNYVSYCYDSDTALASSSGAFYIAQIAYGGNRNLNMAHQRVVKFNYETRPDVRIKYVGGAKVATVQRLASIDARVNGKLIHTHKLTYDQAPSTGGSRLVQVALVDAQSGASVRPLKFSWVNGNPAIFDSVEAPVELSTGDSQAQLFPLDVSAKGKSDLVIAARRLVSGSQKLHLAVHEADANGAISTTPSSEFQNNDIEFPTQLIPIDINGDGRNDFFHIYKAFDSYKLTILLSTAKGYEAQERYTFKPEYIGGLFYAGDFEGNGHVGLVYIYQVMKGVTPQIRFIQFTSDGTTFTPKAPVDGPLGVGVANVKVVVGDLNGNHAEDVFLMWSKSSFVQIDLFESQNGSLVYRADEPLVSAGKTINWLSTISFLPFGADEDGKTSLLVATKNLSGNLQVQMLRSTGPTLLPPTAAVVTNIPYDGNLTLARTTTPFAVDLLNTFAPITGSTRVDVLRFSGDSFVNVAGVTQPGVHSSFVSWADLRGIGRADCVLSTLDYNGKLSIAAMPCSTLQPIDYITGYENGLGAKVSVTYAPLSDRTTYTTDTTSRMLSSSGVGSPLSAVSGMARNVSFTTTLSTSSASALSPVAAQARSQIVYFPSYVVKQLSHAPYAAKPSLVDETAYTYKNARYSYDGRGWQGFESVDKISRTLGSQVSTAYYQDFPLVGQIKAVACVLANTSTLLQTTTNSWKPVSGNGGKNQHIALSAVKESFYEGGVPTYDVNVSYENDSYGNITTTTIQTQGSKQPLTILSEYDNNTSSWVLGNKTVDTVKQGGTTLKQTKYSYHPASSVPTENSQWVKGNEWSTQTADLDAAGNEITIHGPGPALRKLSYDSTHSYCTSSSVYTSATESLTESATYDIAFEQPISTTTPNGEVTSVKYDVLGRMVETSLGGIVVTKQSYEVVGNDFQKIEYGLLDPAQQTMYKSVSHIDGMNRAWKTERPRPDSPSTVIYSEFEYDGAGRLVRRSRDYFSGTTPTYSTTTYDALSRVIKRTNPAASSDVAPLTVTYEYSFSGGTTKVTQTRSDGQSANNAITTQYVSALPNPQPSSQNLVRNLVVKVVDEVGNPVDTTYDGLGRPISVSDAGGVELAVQWDGTSRIIDKKISQPVGGSPKLILHTSSVYEDDLCQMTAINNLAGTKSVMKLDWVQRPLEKKTADETLTFKYDVGGHYSKERLVSVSSTKNIERAYDYDIHGHLTSETLTIDGGSYTSSYAWSLSGALLQVTNPDRSVVNRTLLTDGKSISNIELLDASGKKRASVALGDYSDVFSRPLKATFGNGIVATSALAENGTVASLSLARNGASLHSQSWKIDAFSRIRQHDVKSGSLDLGSGNSTYAYNPAGQLTSRSLTATSEAGAMQPVEAFSYDQSGNLTEIGTSLFVNNGWQLSEIRDQSGATQYSFKYSDDGKMTAKLDASGTEKRVMKYDSEGRLSDVDGTKFVYDFTSRLIKATHPNGDVTIYPTQSYEVDIRSGGTTVHSSYIVQGYRRAALTSSSESSSVNYFHTDHLGSITAVSDESGDIITQYDYGPYGQASVIKGTDVSRYKFSGKEQFGDLYYFGARFYDPEIGRFLTIDNYPLSMEGIKPSTFNMYLFSRNDPINFIDLNGNVPWWHWLVDAVLVAVGIACLFIPVVGSVIGGALIGAGVNGFGYDIQASISGENNDKDWGIQLGIGAAIGAIGGAASGILDAALPAASFANLAGATGANGAKIVGTFVLRTTIRMGIQTALGSGLSALGTVMENAIYGRPLGEGVAQSAATGAWQGAVASAFDFGIGLKGEKTAVNKFWQQKGSYDVTPVVKAATKFNPTKLLIELGTNLVGPIVDIGTGVAAAEIDRSKESQDNQTAQSAAPGQINIMAGSQIPFPRFLPIENASFL
ncbi:Insecticide toxin TcdB middle/N-terminal domain-containing protein [Pleurotus pulmonarius]